MVRSKKCFLRQSFAGQKETNFRRLELLATLTGKPLYLKCGYTPLKTFDVVLPDGVNFPAVQMEKRL